MTAIGRCCIVRDLNDKSLAAAIVIDDSQGTAKRVRLQSGEHAGEVRMPSAYDLIEFVDSASEAKTSIANAFSEMMME